MPFVGYLRSSTTRRPSAVCSGRQYTQPPFAQTTTRVVDDVPSIGAHPAIQFSRFEPGQQIRAVATYRLTSRDVPLLMLGSVDVRREHVEVIPRFRGLPAASS